MEQCAHDWRHLHSNAWLRPPTDAEREAHARRVERLKATGGGFISLEPMDQQKGTIRHWYCTRCRAIDITHHEGEWKGY